MAIRHFAETPQLQRRLLAGTAMRPGKTPDSEIRLGDFILVQKNLTEVIGEDWPLRLAPVIDARMLGALEVAFRSARTFGDSLKVGAKFGSARAPHLSFGLTKTKTTARLVISKNIPLAELALRVAFMAAVAGGSALMQAVLGRRVRSLEFHFPWPEPPYASLARAALPGTVKFGTRECAIVAPASFCDLPSPFADAALFVGAVAALKQASGPFRPTDFTVVHVARYLECYDDGRPTEIEVAKMLGLSRRTLTRRLNENNTTFRALLDESLKLRARELGRGRRHSQAEIAHRLGFEDPSSFSRACRRWSSDQEA